MLPSVSDELGIYLRKIAETPLLSREDERAIAEKVCRSASRSLPDSWRTIRAPRRVDRGPQGRRT